MTIIAFTGEKGSGKDTAAQILEKNGFKNEKFAGALKAMNVAFLRYYGHDDEDEIKRLIEGDLKETHCSTYAREVPAYAMMEALLSYLGMTDEDVLDHIYGPKSFLPLEELCGKTPDYAISTLWHEWSHMLNMFEEFTTRNVQQTLGTDWGRHLIGESLWIDGFNARIAKNTDTVVTDLRFPNENQFLITKGARQFRIINPRVKRNKASNHDSERHIPSLLVERDIINDGSINELSSKVYDIVFGEAA